MVIGGSTPSPSAILDLQSTSKGLLPPRMTTAQRDGIVAPAFGLLILNTTRQCAEINIGSPGTPNWSCLTTTVQGTLDIRMSDTIYWNNKLNASDTISLSNRIDAEIGLPTFGNSIGNILYWNGTTWVRISPGLPGQFLTLSSEGVPFWSGATFATLSTDNAHTISSTTAVVGGNISADGGSPILSRGVVYGTSNNPTTASSLYSLGTGIGPFSGTIYGLSPSTVYYFRSFATNSAGTVYGNEQSFTTFPAGAISSLDCSGVVQSGNLISGKSVSGTEFTIPYDGGNGGSHDGQTVNSTDITGLTAVLAPGSFTSGTGSINYTIQGVPSGSGAASFAILIGGKSCTLGLAVAPASIGSLNCANAVGSGTITEGTPATNVRIKIPYTGGNGGAYSGQVISSMGVSGLTATLSSGNFVTGSDSLVFTIGGTPSSAGTASFSIGIGGQNCAFDLYVSEVFIFKSISGGNFTMGCTNTYGSSNFDPYCLSSETPVRSVSISPFLIGETEVTQTQWEKLMGSNPSNQGKICPQCPVEGISWYDAIVFCNRLSESQGLNPCYFSDASFTQVYGKFGDQWFLSNTGNVFWKPTANGYRLPTEAEWEYAARGGSSTNIYAGGNDPNQLAWYTSNSGFRSWDVKLKLPNGFNLYDMSGNVFEWCWDLYDSYPSTAQSDPKGPDIGYDRVFRSGSWWDSVARCRVANRAGTYPSYRNDQVGFRLVKSP